MSIAKKNCLDLTIEDAKHHDWEGLNFLDKAALTKKATKVYNSLDTEWEKQREAVRKKITQELNSEKWKKDNPSHEQEEQTAALLTRYKGKKLTDLQSQKNIYWLFADQIIPSKPIFRDKVKKKVRAGLKKDQFINTLHISVHGIISVAQRTMETLCQARSGEIWLQARSKLHILLQTTANYRTPVHEMRQNSDTLQKLRETLQIRHGAILVQENDRNRHKCTKEKGHAQKTGHLEEADLQLQSRQQSTTMGGHAP
jgi:hypothetical protein